MSVVRAAGVGEVFGAVWLADDFAVVWLDDTYVYSAAHDRLDDVVAGKRVHTETLTGKATTGGVLTADDPTPPTLAAGDTIRGAWLYHDTGVDATSELLVFFDRDSAGVPIDFDTDGGPVRLTFPTLPYGLLKL